MNRIEKLISEICPEGVPFVALGSIAQVANRGVDKVAKADEGEVFLLNFMDVYKNREITPNHLHAKTTANSNQIRDCDLRVGDIIITPTSETRDDLAHAAVVAMPLPKTVYSYHVMRIRILNQDLVDSKFLAYQFRSRHLQTQILSASNGITRFGLTKPKWESLLIQIPPLEIQKEIVRILDAFTELEAELEAEQEARKIQYEFYHKKLVGFGKSDEEVNWSTVQDVCADKFWLMPATPKFEINGEIPYVTSKNLSDGSIDFNSKKMISHESYRKISKNRTIAPGDILIGMIGTIGEVGYVQPKDLPFYGQNMYLLRLNPLVVDTNYFLQFINSAEVRHHFTSVKHNSSQGYLKAEHIENLRIPLPPLSEQKAIAKVLDTFKELTANLTYGLPAEISSRRKQYEYYLNRLLTFKELQTS
jgi:type I restriction enzyme S subunit